MSPNAVKESHGCIKLRRVSKLKVEENGRSAVFLNPQREKLRLIKVDGCLVTEGPRCDWIISKAASVDVLIELKGVDVDHAVEQIVATLKVWVEHPRRGEVCKLSALIVCRQYPRIDTKIQRAKKFLAKAFGAPLHIRTRTEEYDFSALSKFTN